VNTWRIWCWRACTHYRERPSVIGKERIRVGVAVIQILIVNIAVEDSNGALFTKLEVRVRSDVIAPEVVVGGDGCATVLAGHCACDVIPGACYVNRLAEIDADRGIIGSVNAITYRISS